MSNGLKQFLSELGIQRREIQKINLWADQINSILGEQPELQAELNINTILPIYNPVSLPSRARSLQQWAELGCENPDFIEVASYLISRGDVAQHATAYYWTPEGKNDMNKRLIIPCMQDGRIVGWTARSVTPEVTPKYIKETQKNFLFNSHMLTEKDRKYVFIVAKNATKPEVKKAIKDIYKVDVAEVNIVNRPAKRKRFAGRIQGAQEGLRKAIVTLKEGQKIDLR